MDTGVLSMKPGTQASGHAGTGSSTAPTVAEIMTRRIETVSMDDELRLVREIFEREKFHHLIVVESGRAVGVISDRDLLKHLSPFLGRVSERAQDSDTLRRRAHQVMSRPLVSCGPEASITFAARLMLERKLSCLPVIDGRERCVGIVTLRDVLAWALVWSDQAPDACALPRAA